MNANPKVFVSHAGEDQARFVEEFCRLLRCRGIDAWYSGWEMKPGDSLVDKIFGGLDSSDAFVIVVSKYSTNKPWVQEELATAVMRSVSEGRAYRIIPVRIDEDAVVPTAVAGRLWVNAYSDAKKSSSSPAAWAAREIARALDPAPAKPPLTSFLPASRAAEIQGHASVDNWILLELAKRLDVAGPYESLRLLDAHEVADEISRVFPNIDEDDVMESIHYLLDKGDAVGNYWARGGACVTNVSRRAWEMHATRLGYNLDELERRFLAYLQNGTYSHERVVEDLPSQMLRKLVFENLVNKGLVNGNISMTGVFYSQGVRPAGIRYIRDGGH